MRSFSIAFGILMLCALAAGIGMATRGMHPMSTESVVINNVPVTAAIASTPAARMQGLSGRLSLKEGEGMLFVFPEDGMQGFWMKDMLFPIDIIWLDASGTVITVAPSLAPSTYPEVFYPAAPARYVLEVPAGFSEKHTVVPGSVAQIPQGIEAQ